MLSQVDDLQRLAVGSDIFGFVVRIGQMMIHLDHCRRQRQQLGTDGMRQIEVEQPSVDVAVVAVVVRVELAELVESLIKRDKDKIFK